MRAPARCLRKWRRNGLFPGPNSWKRKPARLCRPRVEGMPLRSREHGMNPALQEKLGEVVVDGKRLETLWVESGGATAATIVMLHEGLGSIALWRDFLQSLAARTGCGVLVYSRYGHGESERLAEKRSVEFMHHEGEVVLPELLDKLNIAHPILVGHSDGGSISLILAGRHPSRVRALVLEAPHVFVEDLTVASIYDAK